MPLVRIQAVSLPEWPDWFEVLLFEDGIVGFCNLDRTRPLDKEMADILLCFARQYAYDFHGSLGNSEFASVFDHDSENPMGIYVRARRH